MRLLRDKRGVARVIEAFLASMLLMSCIALVPSPPAVKDSSENLVLTAQNVLLSLDSSGHLATLIENQNWGALKNCLESALPLTTWFNLTIFDKNLICINSYPICNSGAVSDKIVSVNYVCASQSGTYTFYILQLQLSKAGLS